MVAIDLVDLGVTGHADSDFALVIVAMQGCGGTGLPQSLFVNNACDVFVNDDLDVQQCRLVGIKPIVVRGI